jgi:hypothetical protein
MPNVCGKELYYRITHAPTDYLLAIDKRVKGDATLYSRFFSVAREADTSILALLVVPVFR